MSSANSLCRCVAATCGTVRHLLRRWQIGAQKARNHWQTQGLALYSELPEQVGPRQHSGWLAIRNHQNGVR